MKSDEVGGRPALPERDELTRLLSVCRKRDRSDFIALGRLSQRVAELDMASGRPWDDRDTGELTALIAQYESIRAESMQTINNRTQIMLLGLAAMGALIGGSLTIGDPAATASKFRIYAIFSAAVPLVFVFVFLVWLSEAVRAHRAGYFLASDVEARINAKLGRLVNTWETSLWTAKMPRDEIFGPSMMAILVLALLATAAPPFGMIMSATPFDVSWKTAGLLGAPYLAFLLTAVYARQNLSRLKNNPVLFAVLPGESA